MIEQSLPTIPTRQAIEAQTRSEAGKVTGKLAKAIDLMIEEGVEWNKAAMQVELSVRTMRLALQRPHVLRHIKERREVFRAHVSAANIHRARELRDQDDNKTAAVQAMRMLEQMGDEAQANQGVRSAPGMVVVVVGNGAFMAHERRLDPKPLIDNEIVRRDDDE